nr:hypothetical protein Iba_chr04bCG12240 [Ipomoea batatas]GME14044.1 hypothetical protein Iba_scaffold14897CG0830 [Ipomoea batatas]
MPSFHRRKLRNDVDLSRSVAVTPQEAQSAIVVTPELIFPSSESRQGSSARSTLS